MSDMPAFPAFIRLEHQPNGSAKQSFLAEVSALAGDVQRKFDAAYTEVGKTLTRSITSLRAGKIGFDIDVSGLRQAAAQADHTVQRLNLLKDAAISLAAKTGDTSTATKTYIDALRAQVVEAERVKSVADGQVVTYSRLQAEIDRTVSGNLALADSYRAIYVEQARAENAALASQKMFNRLVAPGLESQPKSAAESAAVFESQSYAPKADTRSDLDRFLDGSASLDKAAVSATTLEQVLGRVARRGDDVTAALEAAAKAAAKAATDAAQAEEKTPASTPATGKWGVDALLAGQATLDRAAVSSTTLEQVLGRVAVKGAEVGAALEQAARLSARALEDQAKALKLADAEMAKYAAEANQLLQRLDPALAVQQRFDQELEKAQKLFAAGAISAETYAAAQQLARDELQQGWAAITAGTNDVANAAKRGTTAHQSMINSLGASRQAYTMLGQQMQDVVVQAQLGTNAIIIFTQQVPQAAFALSGLAESSNKTEQKIGQFASFLSGPYGAAIFAAIAIGGPFIANLLNIGDEAEKTKGKVYDFSGSFDVLTLKVGQSVEAMDQLAAAAKAAIEVNGNLLKSLGLVADASVASLEKRISDAQVKLTAFNKKNDSLGATLAPGILGPSLNEMKEARQLTEQLASDRAALEKAKIAQTDTEIAESEQRAISSIDKRAAAMIKYKNAVGALNDAYRNSKEDPVGATNDGTFINQAQYEERRRQIEKEKQDALDALKKPKDNGAKALANFGERSDETIKRLSDKFSEQPKLINDAMSAIRQLDTMMAKLEQRKPKGWADMVEDAKAAKREIQDFFGRQADQIERNSQRQMALQTLTAGGRDAEAQALQYIWQLEDRIGTEEQIRTQIQNYINQGRASEAKALQGLLGANIEMKQRVIEVAQEEQRHNEMLKRKQILINAYSSALQSTRSEMASILGGLADPSKIRGNFENILKQLRGQMLTESIFGDVFADMDKYVRRHSGIDSSVDQLIEANNHVSQSAKSLADALDIAAGRVTGKAANDNASPIGGGDATTVGNGTLQGTGGIAGAAGQATPKTNPIGSNGITVQGADLTLERWVEKLTEGMAKKVLGPIDQKFNTKFFSQFSSILGGAMAGNVLTGGSKFGTAIGALSKLDTLPKDITKGLDSVLSGTGLSTSNISKAFGSALSGLETSNKVTGLASAVGIKLDSSGSSIGGALGALSGIPGGDIIGSIAGGVIGNLFKVSQRGTVVVKSGSTSATGSTNQTQSSLYNAGNTIQDRLSSIASSLSTTVGDFAVSIGRYKDYYRVSASGSEHVGDKYYPNSAGADILYDGTDLEEAVAIAVKNAIMDGAIKGISQTSKNILAAGSDISTALTKVQAIESIPKRIKAFTDPVGAALDDLNGQFSTLVGYLKEGSASTEQYAQAQQLYELERAAAIKQATQQVTGSLQSLYDTLTVGNDARSLSERKAAALATYQPLAAKVAAGDTTAFEDYAKAAQTLVDIERQLSGSQSDYFALLDQVTKLTKTAIDAQNEKITAATNSTTDNPFSGISTTTSNDNAAVTDAINNLNTDLNSQLGAVNDNLGSLLDAINSLKASGYSTGTTGSW